MDPSASESRSTQSVQAEVAMHGLSNYVNDQSREISGDHLGSHQNSVWSIWLAFVDAILFWKSNQRENMPTVGIPGASVCFYRTDTPTAPFLGIPHRKRMLWFLLQESISLTTIPRHLYHGLPGLS